MSLVFMRVSVRYSRASEQRTSSTIAWNDVPMPSAALRADKKTHKVLILMEFVELHRVAPEQLTVAGGGPGHTSASPAALTSTALRVPTQSAQALCFLGAK